jgi:UDP-galactopyranose mutase
VPWECDVLVVGAGFAGAVLAERLAVEHGRRVLVVDRRRHLGGNAHDATDRHGVLLHSYGPHYFHTRSERVKDYLSRFTAWRPADYRVLSWVDGRTYSFPINLTTFEQLLGRPSTPEQMAAALARWREPWGGSKARPANFEEAVLARVGRRLYQTFYRGYTQKQWGRDPRELDASLGARIPVRTDRDERYFSDAFQALPADGYTRLFERILAHPRIRVVLGVDDGEVRRHVAHRHLVWTGMIDEYYGFRFGRLPYRSLRFERQTFERDYAQAALQINYPNQHAYTRSVELKHITGQVLPVTTIVREFPEEHAPGREPFYPLPTAEARARNARYQALAARERDVTFVGRLATYRYLNMDQVVGAALVEADRLGPRLTAEAAA